VPYHFILIGAFDKDIEDDIKLSLKKVIANSNAIKAGIYIVLNFFCDSAFNEFTKLDKSLPNGTHFIVTNRKVSNIDDTFDLWLARYFNIRNIFLKL
jgi:hypothetical protein